ncbi:MAG: HAMP domain-containing protein [Betaproteobacteria bacterium]|nr:HAMP domain-containing protein [Betaproteobacteria bacterium]
MIRITLLGNLTGAVLTFVYFRFLDVSAHEGAKSIGQGELLFFVAGFAVLVAIGHAMGSRWIGVVTNATQAPPPGPEGDRLRRRALAIPAIFALLSFSGWVAASLVWGVLWPLLAGDFDPVRALRQMFGMIFISGTTVTAIVFFATEQAWRRELPRFFPSGGLSATGAPRLRVRTRMVTVFLLMSLLPLAVLSVAVLIRARALHGADPATAESIINNLVVVIAVLAAAGLLVSLRLATLVADSVAGPLRDVQRAMAHVERGALDAHCAVVSNDEIGEVAEGFNRMVEGLREREVIRETFGKYVSPEVRDEILAGRASLAGALREVTILFADLRDFTPWVESTPPAEVVADLNSYFTEMDAAIRAHRGLVLQFIGDEIEAVFGAPLADPRHAESAARAALGMRDRLAAWNSARRAAGKVALRHGIGIHTGTVLAGNIGSSERLSYALVGDAVNLASRIQGLNKDFGTEILLSGVTRGALDDAFDLEPLPAVRVKGKSAEVDVYSLS